MCLTCRVSANTLMSARSPVADLRVIGDRCRRDEGTLSIDFQVTMQILVQRQAECRAGAACVLSITMDGGSSHFDALVDDELQCTVETSGSIDVYDFNLPAVAGGSAPELDNPELPG